MPPLALSPEMAGPSSASASSLSFSLSYTHTLRMIPTSTLYARSHPHSRPHPRPSTNGKSPRQDDDDEKTASLSKIQEEAQPLSAQKVEEEAEALGPPRSTHPFLAGNFYPVKREHDLVPVAAYRHQHAKDDEHSEVADPSISRRSSASGSAHGSGATLCERWEDGGEEEGTVEGAILGRIPTELWGGQYVRNGGNPLFPPEEGRDYHW